MFIRSTISIALILAIALNMGLSAPARAQNSESYAYSYYDTYGNDVAIVSSVNDQVQIVKVYLNGVLIQKAEQHGTDGRIVTEIYGSTDPNPNTDVQIVNGIEFQNIYLEPSSERLSVDAPKIDQGIVLEVEAPVDEPRGRSGRSVMQWFALPIGCVWWIPLCIQFVWDIDLLNVKGR